MSKSLSLPDGNVASLSLPSRSAKATIRLVGGGTAGRGMAASTALAPDPEPPASGAEGCRPAHVDGGAVVLSEHRDQSIHLDRDLVDNGTEIRIAHHDV